MLLIHFSCYFGKHRRFLLSGAYAFLTSPVHVPLDTAFNKYDKIKYWDESNLAQKEVFSEI